MSSEVLQRRCLVNVFQSASQILTFFLANYAALEHKYYIDNGNIIQQQRVAYLVLKTEVKHRNTDRLIVGVVVPAEVRVFQSIFSRYPRTGFHLKHLTNQPHGLCTGQWVQLLQVSWILLRKPCTEPVYCL